MLIVIRWLLLLAPHKKGFELQPKVFEKKQAPQYGSNDHLYQVTAASGIDIQEYYLH
jgi:hypothetical protein